MIWKAAFKTLVEHLQPKLPEFGLWVSAFTGTIWTISWLDLITGALQILSLLITIALGSFSLFYMIRNKGRNT